MKRALSRFFQVGAALACVALYFHCSSLEIEQARAEGEVAKAAGAAAIDQEELRLHVFELASDAYEGRETLMPGAVRAGEYLARRFADYRLGVLPGQESFFVPFDLWETGFDSAATTLRIRGVIGEAERVCHAGADFRPFPFSGAGQVAGEVVFAGYGIATEDYDDYAGLDIKGRIALVFRHIPREKEENNPLAGSVHALFATKARVAKERGASAILIVTDPLCHPEPDDLRLPNALLLDPPADDARGRSREEQWDGFLALHVSKAVAEDLVAPLGKNLGELQALMDKGGKPRELPRASATASAAVRRLAGARQVTANNIVGMVSGSDPALKDEWIVVGAHYDHVGAFSGHGDTVYNGADDNASGTAGLLEMAQAFSTLATRPARSIVFAAFSGEEKGLLGSYAMVRRGQLPRDRIIFMLNMDMIGRNPERPLDVAGDGFATELSKVIAAANEPIQLPITLLGNAFEGNSDHAPFYEAGIPFSFFFTGYHDDYHQLGDHPDKIAFDRMEKIVRLGFGIVERFATGTVTPRFIHHVNWLGVEIQVLGQGGDAHAEITHVDDNSRGARAGLMAGDIVRALGDTQLSNPRDVGDQFGAISPGVAVGLKLERAGAPFSCSVTRAQVGYLGIVPGPVDDDSARGLGLAVGEGLRINGVADDGPARGAGIAAGDILLRINGEPVNVGTLRERLLGIGAGERVTLLVVRDGVRRSIELVLAARPS